MSDEFRCTPFAALEAKLLLKRKASLGVACEKNAAEKTLPQEECTQTDTALFLQACDALENAVKPEERPNRGGLFTLADALPLLACANPSQTTQGKATRGKDVKKARKNAAKEREDCALTKSDLPSRSSEPQKTLSCEAESDSSMESLLDPLMTDAEMRAFYKAVDGAAPLKAGGRVVIPQHEHAKVKSVRDDFGQILEGKLEFELLCRDEYFEGHIAGLDQLTVDKLRAGALSPEAHLDLHGCTAVEAFEALRFFVRSSWYKGLRNLLVIPGRGKNSLDRIGILRTKLQLWLTQEPLKRVVIAFCTAQPQDGGPGSVYVLLRKYRKKGRIFWERLPLDNDLY